MNEPRGGVLAPTRAIELGRDRVCPADVAAVAVGDARFVAGDGVYERLAAARAVVEDTLRRGVPAYGVNRGLGPLKDRAVADDLVEDYQAFILASHAAGIGEPLPRVQARAVMATRVAVLAQAGSGISVEVFTSLLRLLDKDIVPVVPRQGSVGSADLAPLAAIGRVLAGEGEVLVADGPGRLPASIALSGSGLKPVALGAKDALSLVGANSASVGIACLLHERLVSTALAMDVVAALTIEALNGQLSPFARSVIAARPLTGQVRSAQVLRTVLADGDLSEGRVAAASLQDPVSVRTVPQIHGVLRARLDRLGEVLDIELNSPSENPLVDVAAGSLISNGNFSSLDLAITVESLRLALAHVASGTERRTALMVATMRGGVDLADQIRLIHDAEFVVPVIIANTASEILAEVRLLATPISLFGGVVGDGVEDHNSHTYLASRTLERVLDLVDQLLAIELMLATSLLTARGGGRTLGRGLVSLHREAAAAIASATSADLLVIALGQVLARHVETSQRYSDPSTVNAEHHQETR